MEREQELWEKHEREDHVEQAERLKGLEGMDAAWWESYAETLKAAREMADPS